MNTGPRRGRTGEGKSFGVGRGTVSEVEAVRRDLRCFARVSRVRRSCGSKNLVREFWAVPRRIEGLGRVEVV